MRHEDDILAQVTGEYRVDQGVENVNATGVVGASWFERAVAAHAGGRIRALFGVTGDGTEGGGGCSERHIRTIGMGLQDQW